MDRVELLSVQDLDHCARIQQKPSMRPILDHRQICLRFFIYPLLRFRFNLLVEHTKGEWVNMWTIIKYYRPDYLSGLEL